MNLTHSLKSKRTVKEVAEQDGVTERTARSRTAEKRKSDKENTETKVIQLYNDELSQRENAKRIGISQGKLQSILKKT